MAILDGDSLSFELCARCALRFELAKNLSCAVSARLRLWLVPKSRFCARRKTPRTARSDDFDFCVVGSGQRSWMRDAVDEVK